MLKQRKDRTSKKKELRFCTNCKSLVKFKPYVKTFVQILSLPLQLVFRHISDRFDVLIRGFYEVHATMSVNKSKGGIIPNTKKL